MLEEGSTGLGIRLLQYYLSYIAAFNPTIEPIAIDGIFGPATRNAVEAFQQTYGLPVTGIVDEYTWYELFNVYRGLIASIPIAYSEGVVVPYPGTTLRVGTENAYVQVLQEYLNYIGQTYTQIPAVPVTGYFGALTYNAVEAFQRLFGLEPTGVVEFSTWDAITNIYEDLYSGNTTSPGQFPGYSIS